MPGCSTISSFTCSASRGFQATTGSDYILGPGGEQVTEMKVSGTTTVSWAHTNAWAAGKLIATYETTGNNLHFYQDDPLGTRRSQTNPNGLQEQTCQSLPFGDSESCSSAPTENLFTQKELDSESNNYYFEARYYSDATGRFLTPDWAAKVEPVPYASLDNPQTLNLYAYVLNNPVKTVDPDGHLLHDGFEGAGCLGEGSFGCNKEQRDELEAQHQAQQQSNNGNAVPKPSTFTLNNSIVSASYTTAVPGMFLGGVIGEAIDPAGGGVVGALLGSTIGVGGNVSYVPGSDSTYIGPALTFTPRLLGGEGGNLSWQFAPSSFKADNITGGFSFSGNVQPTLLGAAGSWSPGNGWAAGPSVGTRVPISVGVSYNFNISSIARPIEHWITSLFQ